jgi:predicted metal-dependent peptidase
MGINSKKIEICPDCSNDCNENDFDLFGMGDLLDEHINIDTDIDDDFVSKKIQDAAEMAKRLGGTLSQGIEGELNDLVKPKLTWQDFVIACKAKIKAGNSKNNWNCPKRKSLFSGLYIPSKIDYSIKFLLAYDCSGSMSKENIIYGISQLQVISNKGEGWCLPWDSQPFFDSMIKIKSAEPDQLKMAKYKGGGGTLITPVFKQYEKAIGSVDIIIVVSDFYLADENELKKLTKPKNTEIVWLSVNGNPNFTPPFGRLFSLKNESL